MGNSDQNLNLSYMIPTAASLAQGLLLCHKEYFDRVDVICSWQAYLLLNFLSAKYFHKFLFHILVELEFSCYISTFLDLSFFHFFKANHWVFSILLESLISSTSSQKLLLIILRLIQSTLITYGEFQHI